MESDEEALRLEIKTNSQAVERQALWAGIGPGMRTADVCCGPGKTTATLQKLVQPGGSILGIDGSEKRIAYAREHYGRNGVAFERKDIRQPLDDLGLFDFVWVRFVLEYCLSGGFDLVRNISGIVKPGGILCLIDLDLNCLCHQGLSPRLERTIFSLVEMAKTKADFDPYAGRKLYSHLYRLGYQDIRLTLEAHHLIYGKLKEDEGSNWVKKIEVVSRKVGFQFEEYESGLKGFMEDFWSFFSDPGRFTYSPLICCRGVRPPAGV